MVNNNSISGEMSVKRIANGIQLIKPGHKNYRESDTLDNILSSSFPVYLEDTAHISIKSNQATANACGFASLKDFIGKSPFRYFKIETIIEKISNHKKVLNHDTFMIAEESSLLKHGDTLNTLSIRMPWYNEDNKIVGLFGCSIVLGVNPLAESLASISKLNLLSHLNQSNNINQYIGSEIDNIYLSKRELECLHLTIKGRPAKQVAYDLKISQYTVQEYLNNIKQKMNVSSKAAMVEKAIEYFESNK